MAEDRRQVDPGPGDYVFARSTDLLRLATNPDYLATMQPIDPAITHPWYRTLAEVRGIA